MAYKSIITAWDGSDSAGNLLSYSVDLARQQQAHLEVLCLGIDRSMPGYYHSAVSPVLLEEGLQNAQRLAREREAEVERRLADEDVPFSIRPTIVQWSGLGQTLATEACFSDIFTSTRPYGSEALPEQAAILESILFDAHIPALVVPPGTEFHAANRVAIAWDESAESLHAIRAALPLLKESKSAIEILMIDPARNDVRLDDPGSRLSTMLARHGLEVTITLLPKTLPRISDQIRAFARDKEADLIVMGAYGHSRFREALLGGATRDMLERTETPVLMAH